MLALILRKELLGHLVSLRFAIHFGICCLMLPTLLWVRALDYVQVRKENQAHATSYQNYIGYHRAQPWIFYLPGFQGRRPLNPLQVFVQGTEPTYTGEIRTHSWHRDAPHHQPGFDGHALPHLFANADLLLFVGTVMSLMALAFTYDAISAERERGTLGLLLSYGVGRHNYILAKWLASLLALAAPLVLGMGMGIAAVSSLLDLHLAQIAALLACIGFGLVYIGVFCALGILVSIWNNRSGTALLALLLLWIAAVVSWPNLAPYLAAALRPLPSPFLFEKNKHRAQIDARQQLAAAMIAWRRAHPQASAEDYWQHYRVADTHYAEIGARRQRIEANRRRLLAEQTALAGALARLSPLAALAPALADLSATGAAARWRFYDDLHDHQRRLIEYVEFFKKERPAEPDISAYPRFRSTIPPLRDRLAHSLPDLLLLVAWNALLLLAAHASFLRREVR